ncbi:MAG: CHAT domain-containing protein, partial [Bacteroidota bacterium]
YSLACNQPEVAAIQDLVGGQSFLAQAASKDHFIQQIKNAGIIHLATHACVDLETDALNQIFFTDDYLTSVELKNLQLQARMAVLSACNTGSGKLQTGEGLMSLARSFTIAGCPSTLMSLWSVDDCATSDIMLLFYQELKAGKDQPTAIRNAKLQYLATASKEKAHPYYWAPFQMVGASWPVLSPPSNTPYYGLGFVVLLLVFVRWRFIFGAGHKKAI